MALIDTGLGWSADEDYLKQYSGLLGTLSVMGGANWPEQPLPHTLNTNADVRANGFLAAYKTSSYFYYGEITSTPADVFLCRVATVDPPMAVFISPTRNAKVRRNWYASGTDSGTEFTLSRQDATTGLYYSYGGQYSSGLTYNIPLYNSVEDACAALSQAYPYYKLNDGYSVSLFVKYRDALNQTCTTAALISSVPGYSVLSADGSSPDVSAYSGYYVWQGKTFAAQWSPPRINASVSGNTVLVRDITSIGPIQTGSELFEAIARISSLTVDSASDPYQDNPTEPGGGPTEPDDTDDIPFAIPPYISASSSGFVRLFNPTLTEINALASFMWSTGFDLDTLKRVYANPIDYIIGASIVPVIPDVKTASYPITFPGLTTTISTGVSMNEVYQYVTLNCGSIYVSPKWNSYLDWAPYHRFSIWLPYIGFRDIDTDDIMGRTIELQYIIDLLSGACNAELLCGGSVLYSWQGQCGAQIPINSADWSSMLTGAISLAASAVKLGASIATGGATVASTVTDIASAGASAFNLKPSVSRGGTVAGAAGFMAQQTPYIVRTRPELALPDGQAHFIGYPSYTTVSLGTISGYAEVYSVHLHGISATEAELKEIESLLTEGVIY